MMQKWTNLKSRFTLYLFSKVLCCLILLCPFAILAEESGDLFEGKNYVLLASNEDDYQKQLQEKNIFYQQLADYLITHSVVDESSSSASFMMGDCAAVDWNDPSNKMLLAVSATSSTSGNINVLIDGNLSNNNFFYPDSPIAGLEVLRVEFPSTEIITGIEYAIGNSYMFNNNAIVKIQASTDAVSWIDMVPTAEGTSPSLVINGNELTKDRSLGNNHPGVLSTATSTERLFWTNTTAYKYYRIIGVGGNTNQNPWINELFFQTNDGFEVTNLSCNDNSTFSDYTDDLLVFDFAPLKGSGSYTVAVDGGFTITPSTGMFGSTTSFTVSAGSSGAGDLNLTISDASVPCTSTVVIPNSNNACIPGACGGPDWNVAAIKSTITGDFHIPGTGATDGPLTTLVDSNAGTGPGSKNNSFTNQAVFTMNFPEATELHGFEVVVSGTPISGGVFRMEGSNDGNNYSPVSIDFTFGTNLSLGAAQYGTGTQAYTFPFADNANSYTYYRLYATSMNTAFGSLFNNHKFTELYFDYDVFNGNDDNITFGDNGTPGNFSDDVVDFDINPSPGTGSYSVQMQGGYTITPSTGTYGQVTSFQVSEGSAGTGDLTFLLIDEAVPCVQQVTIANPDLTATVESSQAACANPTDDPLGTITFNTAEEVFTKLEYNVGAAYNGTGFATATDIIDAVSGFEVVNNLANPDYTTYYTVRAYVTETLFRDFVVSLEPKVCSVADLSVTVSPATANANEGEQFTYIVNLTNNGPDPAVNVEVKVDIPSGLELLSTTPSVGDYSAGTQLWTTDLVPVGSHQLSITYRMK